MLLSGDTLQNVEDFGVLLLRAQKDLERVRQRLNALPVQKTDSTDAGAESSSWNKEQAPETQAIASLKEVLNRTQSSFRCHAEMVFSTVEQRKHVANPSVNPLGNVQASYSHAITHATRGLVTKTRTEPSLSATKRSQSRKMKEYLKKPVLQVRT
jgi:hypothetical protein